MTIFILCLLGFFLLAAYGVWTIGVKSQTPKRVELTETPKMPFEDVSIPGKTGKLKGWFIPSVNRGVEKSPLIMIVHGWGSSRSRMLRYVEPLYIAGYSLLLFDIRGHGDSDGVKALTVKTFRDDVVSAVIYAQKRKEVDPYRIGILAHSFGGFGSLLANKRRLGIKALVTDSIPTQFRTIMETALKKYKLPYFPLGPILTKLMFIRAGIKSDELKGFDARQALNEQKTPILMIHSKNDHYVPPSELTYLIENQPAHSETIEFLFVESKGHRSSETDLKFWQEVIPFFERNV
ncbi:alpha/beta hydrolase [Cytobacillus dafuensis]|uniref:Alpha/beta fold hydrolase n=1 Tax=Cytobacillus dafuensis TaxID=1742359 RepID=A0A5B8YZJ4_CYTDA|nr:alpha/beta fold hydrolase [Cytobacillus dafuensis]QED46142.1 alpha/beta fold hydrolase [Cytobacillus dafuensis]